MANLIPNGTYRIHNVKHPDCAVNLIGGLPFAAITSYPTRLGPRALQWNVSNLGNNRITLENVGARGFYASTYMFCKAAPLFGSRNLAYWIVQQVSAGKFKLVAESLEWTLPNGGRHVTIHLSPVSNETPEEHQWTFENIADSTE